MIRKLTFTLLFIAASLGSWAQPAVLGQGFSVNDSVGCTPFLVQFTCTEPNVVSWDWDFGNGLTSTQQNPNQVFNIAGFLHD